MRDLTHYFITPKEDSINKDQIAVVEIDIKSETGKKNKPVTKKRKISLSRKKKTISTSKESIIENYENVDIQGEVSQINKKRKIVNGRSCKETVTNLKKIKLCKTKSSKVSDINNDISCITKCPRSNTEDQVLKVNSINDGSVDSIIITSDDEPVTNTIKNKNNNRSLNISKDEESVPLEGDKLVASQVFPEAISQTSTCVNNGSRNSLLGYFNRVSKEIAINEQTCNKVQEVAQIHLPPNKKDKSVRSKLSVVFKKSRKTDKKTIDDTDLVEVVSSEIITLENIPQLKDISSSVVVADNVPDRVQELNDNINVKPTNIASIFKSKRVDKKEAKEENITIGNEKVNTVNKKQKIGYKTNNLKSVKYNKVNDKNKVCTEKFNAIINENNTKCDSADDNNSKTVNGQRKVKRSKRLSLIAKNSELKLFENRSCGVKNEDHKSEVPNFIKNEETSKRTSRRQKSKLINVGQTINGVISADSFKNRCKILDYSPTICEVDQNGSQVCYVNPAIKSTPQKSHPQEEIPFNINGIRTPKEKKHTINGYFTPKVNNSRTPIEKSCKQKNPPSPWVMKVRLSSAKKNPDGTSGDEENIYSIQKKEKSCQKLSEDKVEDNDLAETKKLRHHDEDIVVINDEDSSTSSGYKKRRGRSRLCKSAKKLDYATEEEPKSSKTQVKVWPFFQKEHNQQTKELPVDEEKLKAKLMFLESGVPDVLKRRVQADKSEQSVGQPAPFPIVNHVTQIDNTEPTEDNSSTCLLPRIRCKSPPVPSPNWTHSIMSDALDEQEIPVFNRPSSTKSCLHKIKDEVSKSEVKTIYKCLKHYKSKADTDIWTEVYRPIKCADIVGNSDSVKKLRSWLESFKLHRRREGSVSSGEDFVNDDSDEEDRVVNNLAVVSGPYGCGKTCAVYAIAAELDYKVLEINASCNRSGKRILAEFSESTQSHQVERAQPINGLLKYQSMAKTKKRKRCHKASETKSETTSLILVEDADLLFTDTDEGFMQALSSLAASAKRPLILVTNQESNPHLDRFHSNRPLVLTFCRPKPSKVEVWLRLVGLVEGVEVSADQAKHLVAWSGCDVRRALLQLQLMVLSNNSEIVGKIGESKLWWEWPVNNDLHYELPTLLETAEPLAATEQPVDKQRQLHELKRLSLTTGHLAYLDIFSARSSHWSQVIDEENPCPTPWEIRCRDSTAQLQRVSDPVPGMGTDLSDWLAESIAREGNNAMSTNRLAGQTAQEARWLSILHQSEEKFLKGVSPTVLSNHGVVTCDYLPTLREIGRAEQVRLTNYSRRASRFFNYLQGLGINANKSYRDFMCDAFS